MQKFVRYIRLSKKHRNKSKEQTIEDALGIEAQEHDCDRYCLGGTVIATYYEIESGRKSNRVELKKAVAHAKAEGAVLVVAKLDRLARNVLFTATLMESGVEFVCCDNPHATRLTIQILAAIAEDEARRIGTRIKAALGVLKTRGVKLGMANPVIAAKSAGRQGWRFASPEARAAQVDRLRETYGPVIPIAQMLRGRGDSLQQIAAALNDKGYTTAKGSKYTITQVQRLLTHEGLCKTA